MDNTRNTNSNYADLPICIYLLFYTDQTSRLNWWMIVHLHLRTSGCEVSNRLACGALNGLLRPELFIIIIIIIYFVHLVLIFVVEIFTSKRNSYENAWTSWLVAKSSGRYTLRLIFFICNNIHLAPTWNATTYSSFYYWWYMYSIFIHLEISLSLTIYSYVM